MRNKAVALLFLIALAAAQPALASRAALTPFKSNAREGVYPPDDGISIGDEQGIPTQSQNIILDGHLGGQCRTVSIQGRFAYTSAGVEMTVLDISNRGSPKRVGYLVFPAPVVDVHVQGETVYTVVSGLASEAALWAVDVSAPYYPRPLGSLPLPGRAEGVTVAGHYAYVAGGKTGLHVVDVSTPAAMREIGSHDTAGQAVDLFVDGRYAYVADFDQGLSILDVGNPAAPKEIGHYKSPWYANGVDVEGRYAYVVDAHMGLRIVDVQDPTRPVEIGGINITEAGRDVVVSGHYAFVTDSTSGFVVVDISDPTHPTWEVKQFLQGYSMDEIALAGEYAYVASESYGLRVIHLADPLAPVQVASYDPLTWPWDVAVQDGFAYAADIYNGLAIIDVFDPMNPSPAGSDGVYGEWNSLDVNGKYAYLLRESRLRAVDITDPLHPTAAGEYDEGGVDIAVSGSYAYLASLHGVLEVIDISQPAAMHQVDQLGEGMNTVAVDGRYLCTAGYGLQVWDLDQPDSPELLGTYYSPLSIEAIALAGQYVYLLSNNGSDNRVRGRLSILDLGDPSKPVLVSSLDLPTGYFFGLEADGRHVFLISHPTQYSDGWIDTGGLYAVDVSQPAAPVMIGSYSLPSINNVSGVDAMDGEVYVATNEGLFILRLGYTVTGKVQHANGQPFAGAAVSAGTEADEVITDADGRYTLSGLLAGTHTLSAQGGETTTKPSYREITLPPDANQIDFTLLPASTSAELAPGLASSPVLTDTQGLPTRLVVPAGAVTVPAGLTLEPILVESSTWLASTGHAFNLKVSEEGQAVPKFSFAAPVTVSIRYSDQDLRGSGDEGGLRFLHWYKDAWQDPQESCGASDDYAQDLKNNTISAVICQSGTYALFVPAYTVFYPVVP